MKMLLVLPGLVTCFECSRSLSKEVPKASPGVSYLDFLDEATLGCEGDTLSISMPSVLEPPPEVTWLVAGNATALILRERR